MVPQIASMVQAVKLKVYAVPPVVYALSVGLYDVIPATVQGFVTTISNVSSLDKLPMVPVILIV